MQQIAAKNTDIAALPIDVASEQTGEQVSSNRQAFEEFYNAQQQQPKAQTKSHNSEPSRESLPPQSTTGEAKSSAKPASESDAEPAGEPTGETIAKGVKNETKYSDERKDGSDEATDNPLVLVDEAEVKAHKNGEPCDEHIMPVAPEGEVDDAGTSQPIVVDAVGELDDTLTGEEIDWVDYVENLVGFDQSVTKGDQVASQSSNPASIDPTVNQFVVDVIAGRDISELAHYAESLGVSEQQLSQLVADIQQAASEAAHFPNIKDIAVNITSAVNDITREESIEPVKGEGLTSIATENATINHTSDDIVEPTLSKATDKSIGSVSSVSGNPSATDAEPVDGKLVGSENVDPTLAEQSATEKVIPEANVVKELTSLVKQFHPELTDVQEAKVKSNLATAVSEFQQQLNKGHVPAIDLAQMVETALKEANLTQTATQEQQFNTQLLQLSQQSQSAVQTMTAMVSPEAIVSEVNQLQSESKVLQSQRTANPEAIPVNTPEGQKQLGEQVRWMINARQQMADIRIDPPEMGSMQIRVNVTGDSASVNFVVQNAAAKEMLAEAIPKLRDMLAEQGIQLGESHVEQQNQSSGQQFAQQQGSGSGLGTASEDDIAEGSTVIEQTVTRQMRGGVDAYA